MRKMLFEEDYNLIKDPPYIAICPRVFCECFGSGRRGRRPYANTTTVLSLDSTSLSLVSGFHPNLLLMQVLDMRALRAVSIHKHLLTLYNRKLTYNPFHFSSHYSTFSRQIHRRFGSQASSLSFEVPNGQNDPKPERKPSKVWTVYEPLSGRLVTEKVQKGSGEEESGDETEKSLSSSEDGVEELLEQRTYGSVKNVKSGAQGTMTEFSEGDAFAGGAEIPGLGMIEKTGAWLPQSEDQVLPMRLKDVKRGISHPGWRISLPGLLGEEVSMVLGGGLVPGSLVLVGGDPGIGKSTLILQIAALIAEGGELGRAAPVLYVSGEESVDQIGNRADRMGIGTEELFLYSSTDIQDIVNKAQLLSPRALIIDSIQTVYLSDVTGSAGGITQVKECTSALLRYAKKTNVPVLLIGHVTKSGEIAGPRVLEHIVDVVLYLEVGTFPHKIY
uniref:RecA family profile 1 domain-containing protein n=1 Tax=Cannabis sativa TaxID=3483 RepID=A0A803NZ96_CANSA